MNTYTAHDMSVALPPAKDLLLKSNDEDQMIVDDKVHDTMTKIEVDGIDKKGCHYGASSVQQQPQRLLHTSLPPLEPDSSSSNSSLYEQQTSYSRRGSMAAAIYNHTPQGLQQQHQQEHNSELLRKPSITEMNKLSLPPLNNSGYRDSPTSPLLPLSPSSYNHPASHHHSQQHQQYLQHHHPYTRRDSVPTKDIENLRISSNDSQCHPHVSTAESFQRRHSIATVAATDAAVGSNVNQQRESMYNHSNLSSHYQAFRFPATIPESTSSDDYAEERPHHVTSFRVDSRRSPSRKSNSNGGGPMFQNTNRRRLSSLDEISDPPTTVPSMATQDHQQQFLLMRRASVPAVTAANTHLPQQQHHYEPLHRHAAYHPTDGSESRRGSSSSCLIEQLENNQIKRDTPYSRSPELRVSHKLAERKRRKEMKNLFDELRDSLPVDKNIKTSKWEILSKAVEYISILKRRDYELESEISGLKHELNMIKREKDLL